MENSYPSVTQVLSPFIDFSMVPEGILLAATERGKEVHLICAAIANGYWTPTAPKEIAGYINSFCKWFACMVEEVIFSEKEFVDQDYGFIGHPDLGLRINGKFAVVDLKTPAVLQAVWKGQCAAYKHLTKFELTGTLRLDRNGKTAKMDWYEDDKRDFAAFLAALTAFKYFKKGA